MVARSRTGRFGQTGNKQGFRYQTQDRRDTGPLDSSLPSFSLFLFLFILSLFLSLSYFLPIFLSLLLSHIY